MEDNSKTSKFSTGQLCFCLLEVGGIPLFCMFNTKQIHLLSLSLTSLDLPVYCNKLSHYNCNFIMWGWRNNCHRHDCRVTGISLENGMLHVASGMGAFPASSLHPAPHTEAPTCEKSLLKGVIRGQMHPRRLLQSLRSMCWFVKDYGAGEPVGGIQGYACNWNDKELQQEKVPSVG